MRPPPFLVAAAALLAATPARARVTCDDAKLARLDHTLADAPPELHLELVAAGLVEACTLPPALERGLRVVASAGRDFVRNAGLAVLRDDASWSRACPGGGAVVGRIASHFVDEQYGPRERAAELWTGCAVERLGVATRDEWLRAGDGAMLAIAARPSLDDAGVTASRVRAYTRALAGLDEPPRKTLAERFPDDGLRPPRRAHGRTLIAAPPPALTVTLGHYLGTSTTAQALAAVVSEHQDELAPCFAGVTIPRGTTLQLRIADGVAQSGDVSRVTEVAPSSFRVERTSLDRAVTTCLPARAGRLAFPRFARETRIELTLATGEPSGGDEPEQDGGGAGGVVGGVAPEPAAPPGRPRRKR